MQALAKWLGRFGACFGFLATIVLVGFWIWFDPRLWLASLGIGSVLLIASLFGYWASARIEKQTLLASILLCIAAGAFGSIYVVVSRGGFLSLPFLIPLVPSIALFFGACISTWIASFIRPKTAPKS